VNSTVRVFQALLKIDLSRIQDFRNDRDDINSKQDYYRYARLSSFLDQYTNTAINIHHN